MLNAYASDKNTYAVLTAFAVAWRKLSLTSFVIFGKSTASDGARLAKVGAGWLRAEASGPCMPKALTDRHICKVWLGHVEWERGEGARRQKTPMKVREGQ